MAMHVGWVPGISQSLIKLSGFLNALKSIKDAVDACDCPRGILVEVRCKSGRHRSVCVGFCSYHQMLRYGHSALLIHYQSPEWARMKCGATCSACRNYDKCLQEIGSILPQGQSIAQTHGVQSIAQTPYIERYLSRGDVLARNQQDAPAVLCPVAHGICHRLHGDDAAAPDLNLSQGNEIQAALWGQLSETPGRPWRHLQCDLPQGAESPGTGANKSSSSKVTLLSPPLHRHQRGQPADHVELDALLRDDLAQGVPFHGTTARPDLLDKETLSAVIKLCSRDGPRARTFWITDLFAWSEGWCQDVLLAQRPCEHDQDT